MSTRAIARYSDDPLAHQTYWHERAMLQFTEELHKMMSDRSMTRKQLADTLGASKAYVTRVLRGDANFTLATMVKLASALGAELRTHMAPSGTVTTWYDAPALRTWSSKGGQRVTGATLQVSVHQPTLQVCEPFGAGSRRREHEREFDVRRGAGSEGDVRATSTAA